MSYKPSSEVSGLSPNILINGGMDFWQRGTTFTNPVTVSYAADRWKIGISGGSPTSTVTKDTTDFDTGTASLKVNITVTGGATVYFVQQILENYENYRNKTVTFTVRVKCSSAGLIQSNIFDGVTNTNSAVNVGTGWETLTVIKTLSSAIANLAVYVGFIPNLGGSTSASVSTFNVDSAMMVVGSEPTAFIPKDTQVELAQCQRYYQILGGNAASEYVAPGWCWTTALCDSVYRFGVPMRVTPTVTFFNQTGWRLYTAAGGGINAIAVSLAGSSSRHVGLTVQVASGIVAGNATIIWLQDGTSYATFSAEI